MNHSSTFSAPTDWKPRLASSHPKRIVGLFPQLLGVGGVQEACRQTMAALHDIANRCGWLATFLSLNDPSGRQVVDFWNEQLEFLGFARRKLRFAAAAVRACRNDGRIMLAAHPYLGVPAALAGIISPRSKSVVMCHGIEVWQPLSWLRRRALVQAERALSPSNFTANRILKVQRVRKNRIRLLPWPVDERLLAMADFSHTLSVPGGFPQGRVVLTVGRWAAAERYKGVDELIRAVSKLRRTMPDLHLVAVGSGDDLPRLRNLAREESAGDCAHFLENLSCEHIAACYSRADVFVLPSTGEGFGLVFLEAMAFGKPIVAVAAGGSLDLVHDGINGLLVPPSDREKLAEALSRLLGDEPLRLELGRSGAKLVREQHTFQRFRSNLESILRECGLREAPLV